LSQAKAERDEARTNNAATGVYARDITLDEALFRLADDAASDAGRSGAGRSARDGVNDDSGAAVAENGMLVRTERNIWRNYYCVTGSISCDNQRKIGNVSSCQTGVFAVTGGAIEVRASRLKVGRFTLRVLVDVQRVLARRQALHVQLDFDSVRSVAKHGSSNVLTLSVFNFRSNRFGSGGTAGLHCYETRAENHKAHNTSNRSHHSSL
jgi:hypothetical protein